MRAQRRLAGPCVALCGSVLSGLLVTAGNAQVAPSALPPTSPTQNTQAVAPLAGTAVPTAGTGSHAARISCANGLLEVHADNSSLNAILREIARCTGMRIVGGVREQRVFGNYGPAAPATVLGTLIDGTGSNMLLSETAADQPAELILTPRTGGPTPPSSFAEAEDDSPAEVPASGRPAAASLPAGSPFVRGPHTGTAGLPPNAGTQQADQTPTLPRNAGSQQRNQTPTLPPVTGSVVTSPPALPQPVNNVNGSPLNTSPTPGTYPTTNSVPLDSVATPSTTPSTSGIVDAPNPPPAGSDTAAALNGAPAGTPGTTNINPAGTGTSSTPGGTNTTVPAATGAGTAQNGAAASDLTPEQIFQQLRQRQQQQQQQQQQQDQQPAEPPQ